MKYKYKKSLIALLILEIICILFGIWGISKLFIQKSSINTICLLVLFVFILCFTVTEYINKAVELNKNSVTFHSFKTGEKDKWIANITVLYQDIFKISATKAPIIGYISVKIYFYGRTKAIYLPRGFDNDKQLLTTLVQHVKTANINVDIAKTIEFYINQI